MHLHTYRDESRSRHLDLIGRGHRWSIDLVTATASGSEARGRARSGLIDKRLADTSPPVHAGGFFFGLQSDSGGPAIPGKPLERL
jgi:hypothetical protein